MISDIDLKELGKICRRTGKQLGYILEDLEDEYISTSTMSNIERGIPVVTLQKIKYYCEKKLQIKTDHLVQLQDSEEKIKDEILEELWFIERLIEQGNANEGLKELKKVDLQGFQELQAPFYFLKGRAYYYKNNWDKSFKHYLKTIELVEKFPEMSRLNVHSISYNDIGRICFYHEGNLKKALYYTELGIRDFNSDGERQHINYALKICQVLYLEKLNRIQDAYQTVKDLWRSLNEINHLDVILNIYEMRAKLLFQMKRFDDAIFTAKIGLEVSTLNKMPERTLELITTLGSIYLKLNEFKKAEKCFLEGWHLKKQIKRKYLFITTYTQIGVLYIKQGELQKAQSYLEDAVKIGKSSPDIVRYTQALIELGICYSRQKKFQLASEIFEEALYIAKKHTLLYKEKQILTKLTKLWKDVDEEKFSIYMADLFKINVLLDDEEEEV